MSELHVIFGVGPVGQALMESLLARGKRIRVINRKGLSPVPDSVEVLRGDVNDSAFVRRAAEGATHIYNALNPPYHKWPQLFPQLQVATVEAAVYSGAKLIVMENVYMYGRTHGRPMTEDMPFSPHTIKGKVRAKMSQDLMDAHEKGRIRVTMGRASDFVGPRARDTAMGERVFYPSLNGQAAQVLGNPDMPHTYTYVPDIGEALAILGEHDDALGQAWHIPSAETLTTRQFIEMIYAEIGVEPKISIPPKWGIYLLGLFNPTIRSVYEMIYEFEEPHILDHSKFVSRFGNHTTPLAQVVRDTVAWYRYHPQLSH